MFLLVCHTHSSPLTRWYLLKSNTEGVVAPIAHVTAHHLVVMATVATQLALLAVEALPGVAASDLHRTHGEVIAGRVN